MAAFIRVYPGNAIQGSHKRGDVHFEHDRRWVVGIWSTIHGKCCGDISTKLSLQEAMEFARVLQQEIPLHIVCKETKRGWWHDAETGEMYDKLSHPPMDSPEVAE